MPTRISTDRRPALSMNTDSDILVVSDVRPAAESICSVTLQAPDGKRLPPWTPGAHIDLELPNWITRQYSLCGDPEDRYSYRIAVRLEELSRGGSEYIHRLLRSGDTIKVRGPRSTFPDTTPPGTVFIAGGIGITALLAMFLRDHALGLQPTLLYAGRSRAAMPFLEDLPHDAATFIAAKDEGDRLDFTRWAEELPAGTAIAACGPHRMVSAVEDTFSTPTFDVHSERFRAEARQYVNTVFVAECARSGKEVTVEEEETLMDALAKADLPLAAGCREGVCGSCELRVLSGEPEHRDLIGASEGRIYPCVSRSIAERLVLDI